jgi:hypothetical protein
MQGGGTVDRIVFSPAYIRQEFGDDSCHPVFSGYACETPPTKIIDFSNRIRQSKYGISFRNQPPHDRRSRQLRRAHKAIDVMSKMFGIEDLHGLTFWLEPACPQAGLNAITTGVAPCSIKTTVTLYFFSIVDLKVHDARGATTLTAIFFLPVTTDLQRSLDRGNRAAALGRPPRGRD